MFSYQQFETVQKIKSSFSLVKGKLTKKEWKVLLEYLKQQHEEVWNVIQISNPQEYYEKALKVYRNLNYSFNYAQLSGQEMLYTIPWDNDEYRICLISETEWNIEKRNAFYTTAHGACREVVIYTPDKEIISEAQMIYELIPCLS